MKRRRKKITFTRVESDPSELLIAEVEPKQPIRNKNIPKSWLYQDMVVELYQFLNKHRPATWGDALEIIHNWRGSDRYDDVYESVGGQEKHSQFMTDLLWHISTYGPQKNIDYRG